MKIPKINITVEIEATEGRTRLGSPREIYQAVKESWEPGTIDFYESFYILMLSRNLTVNGIYKVSEGGISATFVDSSKIFLAMITTLSSSMVLLHNHPSGTLKPSVQDINLTKKIKHEAAVLQYTVADHIIVTSDGFYSFADEGML